jgi:hypothetical protein
MAREAGMLVPGHRTDIEELKAFEALVRADERALAAPVQQPDHGDELTIAYMSGLQRGKELAAQRQRVVFPTMLRKMWSGGEVQAWLDENVNKENT